MNLNFIILSLGLIFFADTALAAGIIQLSSGSSIIISPGETTQVTCNGRNVGANTVSTIIYTCSVRNPFSGNVFSAQGLSREETINAAYSACNSNDCKDRRADPPTCKIGELK